MKYAVTVSIQSDPKYLGIVRDVTIRFCASCNIDEDLTGKLKLAVDEACSNVIKYAYGRDTAQKIVVKYGINRHGIKIVIEDNGIKADPDLIKGRDLDDVRPGGLGMHFIGRVFDQVRFDPRKFRGNRLVLVKHTGGSDEI